MLHLSVTVTTNLNERLSYLADWPAGQVWYLLPEWCWIAHSQGFIQLVYNSFKGQFRLAYKVKRKDSTFLHISDSWKLRSRISFLAKQAKQKLQKWKVLHLAMSHAFSSLFSTLHGEAVRYEKFGGGEMAGGEAREWYPPNSALESSRRCRSEGVKVKPTTTEGIVKANSL